ncbi:MAG: Phosphate-selective porin, partial [Verrucomicrobia bacterium]|nr:Phosphate-selective porin [Verrucomicrobiota bacterium]
MASSRNRILFFCALLAPLGLRAMGAVIESDASVERRLKALEQQVQALADENRELRKELGHPAVPPASLVEPAGKEAKLVLGGFLQAQAEFGRAADPRWSGVHDRFFFRRARVFFAGNVDDFDFKAEFDLQGNTLGAGTGQFTRANEVYINWHRYPFANLRFGQLKPAFGGEALANDGRIPTVERSLTSDRMTDSRQLAVAAMGDLVGGAVSYYAVVSNGNGNNVSANDNSKFQKSLRVTAAPLSTPTDKICLGIDGLRSTDAGIAKADFGLTGSLFAGTREMWGVDAQWAHGPLGISG